MTSYDKNSEQKRRPLRKASQLPSSPVEMLTPAEIEALRRNKREIDDYAKKVFGHLRSAKALDRR